MKRLWSLSFFLLLTLPWLAHAESPTVVISEIAWAGSSASNADEWFELFNATDSEIDLSGWIVAGAGTSGSELVFPESVVVSASGTFIVSNYDAGNEKTILDVAPQWVTTSVSLSNSALLLTLSDGDGNVIDTAGDGSAPLAGSSGDEKRTMERLFPAEDGSVAGSWISSESETGSPGAILVIQADEPTGEPEPEPEEVPEPEPESSGGVVVDPLKTSIRISELYPAPDSDEEEWVEIENISSVGEFLDGWTVEDASGKATELGGLILPWAKSVILSPKGNLNNSGDTVFLKDQKGRIVDAVSYGTSIFAGFPHGTAPKHGQSLMREEFKDTYVMTLTPTPGEKNVFTDPDQGSDVRVQNSEPAVTKKPGDTSGDLLAKMPLTSVIPETRSVIRDPVPEREKAPTVITVTAPVSPARPIVQAAKKATAPTSRYKGRFYTATVAVPPGVYSKARLRVMVGEALRELRLTKSPTAAFDAGEEVGFIAQEKQDGDVSYLLANIKTLYKTGRKETVAFAETKRWPDAAGPYELTGTVEEANGKLIQVRADGQTGVVESPVSYQGSGLNAGDVVAVKGYYEHSEFPRMIMLDGEALRILQPATPAKPTEASRRKKLSLPVTIALSVGIIGAGLAVYLRQERLKRLRATER